MTSRRRFQACICLAVVFTAFTLQATASGFAPQDPRPSAPIEAHRLEVGEVIECTVEPRSRSGTRFDEPDAFTIEVAAGQAAEFIVQRRGIQVEITVQGPGSAEKLLIQSSGRRGQELLAVVADTAGVIRIWVQPAPEKFSTGSYVLEFTRLTDASPRERALAEAARIESSAAASRDISPIGAKGTADRYERVLSLRETALGCDHPFVARTVLFLATFRALAGERDEAVALANRAISILESSFGQQDLSLVEPLTLLAFLRELGGDPVSGRASRERALSIQERHLGPDHPEVLETLGVLCTFSILQQHATGVDGKAEAYLHRFVSLTEKISGPESPELARALSIEAGYFMMTKLPDRWSEAIRSLERGLAINEKVYGKEGLPLVEMLSSLAMLHESRGEVGKADAQWERINSIVDKHDASTTAPVLQVLVFQAMRQLARGNYAAAESVLMKAAAPDVAANDGLAYSSQFSMMAAQMLADLYRVTGQYEKAEQLYRRLIAEAPAATLSPALAAVFLGNIALIYRARGDIAGAIEHQSRCNAMQEREVVQLLTSGAAKQKQSQLAAMSATAYEYSLSLNIQSAPFDPAATRLAFESILRSKGRVLDAMADSIGNLRRRASSEDRALLDELADIQSRLSNASTGRQHDAAAATQLEGRVSELEQRISARSVEFRAHFQPVMLDAVQKSIPSGAALIEFATYRPVDPKADSPSTDLGARRHAVYVLPARGAARVIDLGDADTVDALAAKVRAAMRDPVRRDARELARQFDELVMRPVRGLLGDETHLLIAPDGELNLVPFAALVDESDRYLVERFRITYLSSGRDLLGLQLAGGELSSSVVVADPDFGSASPGRATSNREITHDSDPTSGTGTFVPLPGTAREATAIGRIVPGTRILSRGAATETAVKQLVRPHFLHFATHGFFVPDDKQTAPSPQTESIGGPGLPGHATSVVSNPLVRSGLALSGANARSSGAENGLLTAAEVAGLDLLGTRLVVLSACKTGVGDVRVGDGVYGLRRALVLAGSQSQVMTLWSVSDRAMSDLMVAFYRNLKRGDGRSDALRHVQLEMLRSKDRAHPFYWAGVIQSGAWTPISDWR